MNHRFCLFYSGFTSYAPSLFFNQKALIHKLESDVGKAQKSVLLKYQDAVEDSEDEYFSYIKTAAALAVHFELDPRVKPATPEEYFTWLKDYTQAFESRFPMTKIDHYYFLYSRKLAELLTNARFAKVLVDLTFDLDKKVNLLEKASKCVRDGEYIIFKLVASAALLSSENRHSYFNTFYKELNKEYERFRKLDLSELNDQELKQLSASLDAYQWVVMNGFKKCINLLKELGV